MAKGKPTRKQRFRAALALAGLTMGEWAELEGITANYLSQVLGGNLISQRLNDRVDAFAREEFNKHLAALAS